MKMVCFRRSMKAFLSVLLLTGSLSLTVGAAGSAKADLAACRLGSPVRKTVIQDMELCLLGDANCDGEVNVGDVARVYAHVKKSKLLTDAYALQCANANGGSLNIGDVGAIYAHIRGSKCLY